MLRRGLLLVVLGLVAVGVVTLVQRDVRTQEWERGGDDVTVRAEVATATPQEFPTVLAARGGPAAEVAPRTSQAVVAHVTWQDAPAGDGTYAFVLLDDRVSPPAALRAYGSWSPGDPDGEGPHWDGRYDALGEHYPWLAGTESRNTGSGWTNDTDALGVPAADAGAATLAFFLDPADPPVERPAEDLTLALVHVDQDGDVRWARKVPLHAG